MMRHEVDYDAYTGEDPDTGQQFLMRRYKDTHGVTYTIATRPHVGATWGPEHICFPEPAGGVA